ncbi:hypothetical protein OOP51_002964 [Salmonella enterica]|nr:hypothetical protein [Salmonella enterica]EKC3004339.1 hypothetical protein [Salmonella enterica]EKC3022415.1 hypothetical protein [Salmonella enterica]EMD3782291.1 hypothetical protein [Salmonella enterica]EMD4201393.1 hypothetical protein [Salmonella enterica]
MEEVKLYVELVGVDPASDADIRIARHESTSWHKDIVAELINQVLDESEAFMGAQGLEGLHVYDVMLGIGLTSSGIWPGFSLEPDTISRISACGASLDFDPYIDVVPAHTCDIKTFDDFTVIFSAQGFHQQRSVIATRGLREYGDATDIFIFQVFKDALKYHNDNSLRVFRKKQSALTLYARLYQAKSGCEESCTSCQELCTRPGFHLPREVFIRLNAAQARFVYWPFERRRLPVW